MIFLTKKLEKWGDNLVHPTHNKKKTKVKNNNSFVVFCLYKSKVYL